MTAEDLPGRRTGHPRVPRKRRQSSQTELVARSPQLTTERIDTALGVFDAILARPDVDPALFGELKAVLLEEREAAVKRGGQEEGRRTSRRDFLRKAAIGVVAAAGGYFVLQDLFSPETQERQRQREVQQRERERQRKLAFERDNTLGLNPSAVSINSWRIRYPQRDETVDFTEASNARIVVLKSGEFIMFAPESVWGNTRETKIAVERYTRLDGVSVPLLVVSTAAGLEEKWVLRDQSTPEINNRVVIFEDLRKNEIIYLSITPTKSQPPAFEVKKMEIQKTVPK